METLTEYAAKYNYDIESMGEFEFTCLEQSYIMQQENQK